MFSISEFSAQISSAGLAKNNLFVARITPPPKLAAEFPGVNQTMTFLCKSVDIPSLDFQMVEVQSQGFGPITKKPIAMPFGPIGATFMVDGNFKVQKFFHRWMQLQVNYDNTQLIGTDGLRLPFELGYKDDYAGIVEVDVFANNGSGEKYTYYFGGAYPMSMGNITPSWENAAEVLTMTMMFTYDQFKPAGSRQVFINPDSDRANGALTWISALNTYGQIFAGIHRPRDLQDLINQLSNLELIT